MNQAIPSCELCAQPGGEVIWQDARLRIIHVADADYPGYCRVIWQDHCAEMTDLDPADRARFMAAVYAVEAALREEAQPDKINLASFGNMVPHLHFHVIPRWRQDRHFPNPTWGAVTHPDAAPAAVDRDRLAVRIRQALAS